MNINKLLSKLNELQKRIEDDGNGENLQGKIADLREYFIYSLAYNLLVEEDNELKEQHIEETSDILKDLNEYEDSKIVNVVYNPMGCYYIESEEN